MGQKKLLQSLDIKNFIKKNSFEFIDSEIVATTNLSKAFGCICEKFTLNNGKLNKLFKSKMNFRYQNLNDFYELNGSIFIASCRDLKKLKSPKNILGGKGLNLSEMSKLGMPVL